MTMRVMGLSLVTMKKRLRREVDDWRESKHRVPKSIRIEDEMRVKRRRKRKRRKQTVKMILTMTGSKTLRGKIAGGLLMMMMKISRISNMYKVWFL
jgi:hypothetical protein